MDVPLSNEGVHHALKSENVSRGVQLRRVAKFEAPSVLHGEHRYQLTGLGPPGVGGGGDHWLTVCSEKDHVLVFESFGRSQEQMEQNYTEPNLKRFFLDAFPDCWISTNTQVTQEWSY